jgi:flagellin
MNMSGIVLSASVRQNLLSLQSTASLLATTQNDLATGNKVNSALDNPTNYFTAEGLNNRASDIGNLLDSIGNGVQVLQAANTGITSLQSLIANAQSIANQVLQTPVGYSTKSNISSTALSGATANNLLGNVGVASNAEIIGSSALPTITSTANSNAVATGTSALGTIDLSSTGTDSTLTGTVNLSTSGPSDTANVIFTVDGSAVTLVSGQGNGAGNTFDLNDIETAINGTAGIDVSATASGNNILLTANAVGTTAISVTGAGAASVFGASPTSAAGTAAATALTFDVDGHQVSLASGSSYTAAQVVSAINTQVGTSASVSASLNGSGDLLITSTGTAGASDAVTVNTFSGGNANVLGFASGSSVTANGANGAALTFKVDTTSVTLAAGQTYTAAQVVSQINTQAGSTAGINAALNGSGDLTITSTGTPSSSDTVSIGTFSSGTAAQFGITTASATGTNATGGLSGETLTIGATGGGTATSITFGTGTGQISTLNALNTALAANNLQATLDSSTGELNIVTSNNAASATIGAIGGTATATGSAFAGVTAVAPVEDPNSQATRASLVAQYNNVLQQINTTAQDSSFNGINLLNGDTLKLVFNETGTSTLSITGVTFNGAGLGLSTLNAGTDFLDNNSANSVLSQLQAASSTLSSEASTLGSNLSIVQIRQDFNKNLINVLQTGASNLTLADSNEEAADSQALSTRQSIAVSALALANQSQESVLQLLR